MSAVIRDCRPSDLVRIREIHESTNIDYRLPDISTPLWIVKQVLEIDGVVRSAIGCYLQAEGYLWSDPSDWGDPEQKLAAIQALERSGLRQLYEKGIDCAVIWLPPGMERFGERLEEMGWSRDRDGWHTYSRQTCE